MKGVIGHRMLAPVFLLLAGQINVSLAQTNPAVAEIHETITSAVANGTIAGAIVIASRDGKVLVSDAAGVANAQSMTPVKPDSVIWLASMSKPITAVAIMMLVEEGKFTVDEPVSKYIPEFAAPAMVRVLKSGEAPSAAPGPAGPPPPSAGPAPEYNLVPAGRAITIKDVLTHTSGLQTIGIGNTAVPTINPGDSLASWVPKLGVVPLDFQPGSRWAYSNAVGFDVLARIVEVASGQSFDVFLKKRIFDPLAMQSTGFRGQRADLADRMPPIAAPLAKDERLIGATFFSGAAGLYGSLDDYRKFAEMLANSGALHGKRILKRASVETMSSNQVGDLFHTYNDRTNVQGMAFGYAVAIVRDRKASGVDVPNGSFGWDGAGGTRFWVTPKEKRVESIFVPKPVVRSQVETLLDKVLGK